MINFYRRIRQKLLANGKLPKYLIYAIGEIALVMIGILLALQVNNWNEKKSRQKQEHEVLSDFIISMESDLENEIYRLIERVKLASIRIENALRATKHAQSTREPYIKGKNNGIPVLTHEANFDPQETIYKTLQSLGVSLISDKALRDKILRLYDREYQKFHNLIDNKSVNFRDYGRPLIRTKFKEMKPEYGFEIMDLDIYDDPVFWNYMNNGIRTNRFLLERLYICEIKLQEVISDIQNFLKKNGQ